MLRTLGRRLLRIVLGLTVALLIAELVLQLAVPKDARYYVWPPHMSLDLEPRSDLLPGIDGESAFRVNSMGFRASEPPDDPCVHILALGGSTTANLYLDQKETWPALFDAELNGRQK